MLRGVALAVGLSAASGDSRGNVAEEARHFVIGKMFSYTCFEGTRGQGRVNRQWLGGRLDPDPGEGPMRYAVLPPARCA